MNPSDPVDEIFDDSGKIRWFESASPARFIDIPCDASDMAKALEAPVRTAK